MLWSPLTRAMDKTETAVLLSGGLDSSVALHWAHRNHRVRVALSFDYAIYYCFLPWKDSAVN